MTSERIFPDRVTAGAALGLELQRRRLKPPLLVLGLPRGGVPVAYEVAQVLKAPLDVMLVRKIGMRMVRARDRRHRLGKHRGA